MLARYEHSSLFISAVSDEGKRAWNIGTRTKITLDGIVLKLKSKMKTWLHITYNVVVSKYKYMFLLFFFGQPSFPVKVRPGNSKGGSITVPLTPCLTGLD
jgi:hypothetical protein